VFFSHNKSVNSVFQPAYQHSRTGPYSLRPRIRVVLGWGTKTRAKRPIYPYSPSRSYASFSDIERSISATAPSHVATSAFTPVRRSEEGERRRPCRCAGRTCHARSTGPVHGPRGARPIGPTHGPQGSARRGRTGLSQGTGISGGGCARPC
jgi:hypothetical protein